MTFTTKLILVLSVFFLQSCVINNVRAEDCIIKEIIITEIKEGSAFDVVLYDNKEEVYYINRGLERGVDISVLEEKLLNKKATLHLYKFWFGASEHISQLEDDKEVLFSEFSTAEDYGEF